MKTQKVSSLFAVCGTIALLGGCASEPESHLVTAPPPGTQQQVVVAQPQQVMVAQPQQVVVTQPQQVIATTGVSGTGYVVMQAPPALQSEAIPPRPSSREVWIAGYWTWQDNHYAWMAGHWERPPSNTTTWINPRWEPEGNAYRFYEGYWN